MADDWHEFFKDFPEFDPANRDLSEAELQAKCQSAPGWRWVEEAEQRIRRNAVVKDPDEPTPTASEE